LGRRHERGAAVRDVRTDATDDKKCVGREQLDTWQREGRKFRHFNGDYLGTKRPPNHLPEIEYIPVS